MLDSDLADLYQVPTFRLNEAVKRNSKRFPIDFMFQLTQEEAESLTSQFAMSKKGRGGRRYLPYVFTEHGVAMLSSVLTSDRAVELNILIEAGARTALCGRTAAWTFRQNGPVPRSTARNGLDQGKPCQIRGSVGGCGW